MAHLANAVLLAGIYLLLAGQIAPHEVLLAVLVGIASAAFAAAVSRAARRGRGLRPAWFAVFVPVPGKLVSDSIKLAAAVPRPIRGDMRRTPLDAGGGVGRRGLAILARSVAPNGYVIRADGEQAVMHELIDDQTRPEAGT
jgi:multisubunit Na+/H+ antiporter MnhE subunit